DVAAVAKQHRHARANRLRGDLDRVPVGLGLRDRRAGQRQRGGGSEQCHPPKTKRHAHTPTTMLHCRFGSPKLVSPSPPNEVPISSNNVSLPATGISRPSHGSQPGGALAPAKAIT